MRKVRVECTAMNEFWAFDPYEILGVPRGASDRTIAAAHRSLARKFHPDIAGDAATVRMMRINAAFDAIRTAKRRAELDEQLASTPWTVRRDDGSTRTSGLTRTAERDGTGGAGPAPGRPSGSVLGFGRHIGWSIGEIARVDPGYLEWLAVRREGTPYVDEIDAALKRVGYRPEPSVNAVRHTGRLGFRRG
jgi:curved DNA-binding protein CbpA